MKIVFFGTPDFAVPVLEEISESHHQILAVVTQPDRLGNRNKLMPPAVKVCAERLGYKVLQYDKVSKQGVEDIKALGGDIFVTCAFGQILSREMLALSPNGTINVHASLLPKYRGSCPIQQSIINGDKVTGVTIMRTEYEVDSGDILLVRELEILPDENAGELFDRLSVLGAKAIMEGLDLIESGKAVYTPQDSEKVTFCKMIQKSDGEIDWASSAESIHNHIRGLYPWPCAYTHLDGELVKLHKARVSECSGVLGACGEVIQSKDSIVVACGDGSIEILELQLPGGKKMNTKDYLRGHKVPVGSKFSAKESV